MCEAKYIDPYSNALCNGKAIYDWTCDFMGAFRQAMLEPWVRIVPPTEDHKSA